MKLILTDNSQTVLIQLLHKKDLLFNTYINKYIHTYSIWIGSSASPVPPAIRPILWKEFFSYLNLPTGPRTSTP